MADYFLVYKTDTGNEQHEPPQRLLDQLSELDVKVVREAIFEPLLVIDVEDFKIPLIESLEDVVSVSDDSEQEYF